MLAGIIPATRSERMQFGGIRNFRVDDGAVGFEGNVVNNSPSKESVHEFKKKQEKKRREEKRKEQDSAIRKKQKLVNSLANLQNFYHKKKVPKTPQKSGKKLKKPKPELIVKESEPCPEFYVNFN